MVENENRIKSMDCAEFVDHIKSVDYIRYLRHLASNLSSSGYIHSIAESYEDVLQIPLQPLADHLAAETYHTFEQDHVKYGKYQEAIEMALQQRPNSILMVVGAGRGPLVDCALRGAERCGTKICKLIAVEKNPNAYLTLLERNEWHWNGRVDLIFGDIRAVDVDIKADIMVSELLGSFSDNELAPECLLPSLRFLKHDGIMIPATSENLIAPVCYPKSRRLIERHRYGAEKAREIPHVVYTRATIPLSKPQIVHRYDHTDKESPIEYSKTLVFKIERDGYLDGFMGYFRSELYDGVRLSTVPEGHTPDMASWFPMFFACPFKILRIGDTVALDFRRHSDDLSVWYEWKLHDETEWNNQSGRFYKIGL